MILPLPVVSLNLTFHMCHRAQNYSKLADKTFAMLVLIRKPWNSSLDLLVCLVIKVSNAVIAVLWIADLAVTFLYLTETA